MTSDCSWGWAERRSTPVHILCVGGGVAARDQQQEAAAAGWSVGGGQTTPDSSWGWPEPLPGWRLRVCFGGVAHEAATAGGGCGRVGMCGLRQMTSDSYGAGLNRGGTYNSSKGLLKQLTWGALG
jgi:hypothetical protein